MAEAVKTVVDEEVPPTVRPTLTVETQDDATPPEAVVLTMYPSPPVPKQSSQPKNGSPPSLPEPGLPATVEAANSRAGYWRPDSTYDPYLFNLVMF